MSPFEEQIRESLGNPDLIVYDNDSDNEARDCYWFKEKIYARITKHNEYTGYIYPLKISEEDQIVDHLTNEGLWVDLGFDAWESYAGWVLEQEVFSDKEEEVIDFPLAKIESEDMLGQVEVEEVDDDDFDLFPINQSIHAKNHQWKFLNKQKEEKDESNVIFVSFEKLHKLMSTPITEWFK